MKINYHKGILITDPLSKIIQQSIDIGYVDDNNIISTHPQNNPLKNIPTSCNNTTVGKPIKCNWRYNKLLQKSYIHLEMVYIISTTQISKLTPYCAITHTNEINITINKSKNHLNTFKQKYIHFK